MNKQYIFIVVMVGIILINLLIKIDVFIDFSPGDIRKEYIEIFSSSITYLLGIISFMYLSFKSMRSHKEGGLWGATLALSVILLVVGTFVSAQDFGYGGLATVPFAILLGLVWMIVLNVISGKNKSTGIKNL